MSEKNTTQTFGQAVVLLAAARGLSRRAWSERVGISYPFAAEIEHGQKAPSWNTLMDICKALEVSPARLMVMIEEIDAGTDVTIPARKVTE